MEGKKQEINMELFSLKWLSGKIKKRENEIMKNQSTTMISFSFYDDYAFKMFLSLIHLKIKTFRRSNMCYLN